MFCYSSPRCSHGALLRMQCKDRRRCFAFRIISRRGRSHMRRGRHSRSRRRRCSRRRRRRRSRSSLSRRRRRGRRFPPLVVPWFIDVFIAVEYTCLERLLRTWFGLRFTIITRRLRLTTATLRLARGIRILPGRRLTRRRAFLYAIYRRAWLGFLGRGCGSDVTFGNVLSTGQVPV